MVADAQTETGEILATELLNDIADAIVTGGAAIGFEFETAEENINVIMNDKQIAGVERVIVQQGAGGFA